jgi:outer membrane protein assembly factor BamA
MIHTLFIFFSCLLFQSIDCTQWKFTAVDQIDVLRDAITEPFLLTHLSYKSDSTLSRKEFEYLTELTAGKEVSSDDVCRALSYLFQKKSFDAITLTLSDQDKGKKVQFNMHGFWRFDGIKISGVWVGKEWYKQFYLMEPGDPFDTEKHLHSVQKMKEACKEDGFFDVTAQSSFDRSELNKTVRVHTTINRGKRFAVRKIAVALIMDDGTSEREKKLLQKQVEKQLARGFLHKKYSKKSIEQQRQELKAFLAQKGYSQASCLVQEDLFHGRHAMLLHWTIDVRKKRAFLFEGNRFFSSQQLLDSVLKFGRSSSIVPSAILAQEIKEAYRKKGFWNCTIEAKDDQESARFIICEGLRARISKVRLKGVYQQNERRLRARCFGRLKRHSLYDQEYIDQAFELLEHYYLKEGFLDATIEHHECVQLGNSNSYALEVTINEGLQTLVNGVRIPGYEHYEIQGPFAFINRSKHAIAYDAALIQEQKRFLINKLQKEGYLFSTVESELVERDDAHCILWNIDPGLQIHFGKTIVQSNSDLPVEKIVRELSFCQNAPWDSDQLKKSFARLKSLNLFDSISFTPLALEDGQIERDLLLKVRKDDPFELRIRAGLEFQHVRQYQTFAGVAYKVGGTFMVKNITNHADLFRFDADVARSHREVHMKYLYPWVFNVPLDGMLDGYAIKYEQPGFIGSKKNLYTLYQNGFLFGIRHKNNYLDFGMNAGFEVGRTSFSDDDLKTREAALRLARAINFDARLLDQKISYLFFEPTVMLDLLDNNLYPSSGTFTLFSCKGMFPTARRFSKSYFFKLLVEHSWFVPLDQIVAAFRVRFGHIFHKDFKDIMPNERFYLGGSNSIRSYETDLAPPTGEFIDDDGKAHAVPRGGKSMFNLNAELRIPVARKAGIVIFQDLGALSGDSFADFTTDKIVTGTGFGLRFFTPIGPLRFDIGFKWKKDRPDERRYNWVLTFGQAF